MEDPKYYFLKNNISVQHSVIKSSEQASITTYNSIHAKQVQRSNAIKICENENDMELHLMNKKLKKKVKKLDEENEELAEKEDKMVKINEEM